MLKDLICKTIIYLDFQTILLLFSNINRSHLTSKTKRLIKTNNINIFHNMDDNLIITNLSIHVLTHFKVENDYIIYYFNK